MPVDLRVDGADQLARVAKVLRTTGNATLRRELYAGIQRATKPLKAAAKDAARAQLPKRGGLNEFVAGSKLATRSRGGGRTPGVRITATKTGGHDLRAIDNGRLRHPVFGNRAAWVTQSVKPGWFTKTMQDGAPVVRKEIVSVLDDVADQLAREVDRG